MLKTLLGLKQNHRRTGAGVGSLEPLESRIALTSMALTVVEVMPQSVGPEHTYPTDGGAEYPMPMMEPAMAMVMADAEPSTMMDANGPVGTDAVFQDQQTPVMLFEDTQANTALLSPVDAERRSSAVGFSDQQQRVAAEAYGADFVLFEPVAPPRSDDEGQSPSPELHSIKRSQDFRREALSESQTDDVRIEPSSPAEVLPIAQPADSIEGFDSPAVISEPQVEETETDSIEPGNQPEAIDAVFRTGFTDEPTVTVHGNATVSGIAALLVLTQQRYSRGRAAKRTKSRR